MSRKNGISNKAGWATTKFQPTLEQLKFAAHIKPSLHHTEKRDIAENRRFKKSGRKSLLEQSQERLDKLKNSNVRGDEK